MQECGHSGWEDFPAEYVMRHLKHSSLIVAGMKSLTDVIVVVVSKTSL